ncbi:hypothetical protein GUF51_07500, partial [Xanthomonas citri pv. citri]|nr:hypothetical protein [Xanthomonas citri pv. citri]
VPTRFKFERHYSLYGALVRRVSHRATVMRHVINVLPPLFNVLHAALLGLWVMNGTAFAVHVQVDEVPHHHHRLHVLETSWRMTGN